MRQGDFSDGPRFLRLLPLAAILGGSCTVIAWFLLHLIDFFTWLFYYGRFAWEHVSPADHQLGFWALAVPVLGGLIIGLMARFGSEQIRGHGIPEALEAILYGKSMMNPKVALLKPLSSAISIGSGGPFGAEGPIIMTGGAAGSLLAQCFHLTDAERKTLLVAGAAAGMSAIFATPLAAILLAVELLLFEWRPRSLVPVATASLTAAALRPWLLGEGPLFPLQTHLIFKPADLILFGLIGLLAGAAAAVLSFLLYRLEDGFHRLPLHWMWWPAAGGLMVGLGGLLEPRALGVGYDVIADLLQGRLPLAAAGQLLGVKALIWLVALASGTSGGVLAPLLMLGCGLGTVESQLLPGSGQALYPLVSMAAMMGGMMRAPFTAIAFALELTQNINALMPMLAATLVAYGFTVLVMKRSILTEKIARRGLDVYREYSLNPLETMKVGQAMTSEVRCLSAGMDWEQAVAYFGGNRQHKGYPVLAADGRLLGLLTAADLERSSRAGQTLANGLNQTLITISPGHSCRNAAELMAAHQIGRLPVVDNDGRLIGILTRSDLLKPVLSLYQAENLPERPFGRQPAPAKTV